MTRYSLLLTVSFCFAATTAYAAPIYTDTWSLVAGQTTYGFVKRVQGEDGDLKIQILTNDNFLGRWRPDQATAGEHLLALGSYKETELSPPLGIIYVPGLSISTFSQLYKSGGTAFVGAHPYVTNPGPGDRWQIDGHGVDTLPADDQGERVVTWRGDVRISATGTLRLKDNIFPAEALVSTHGDARIQTSAGRDGFVQNTQNVSHIRMTQQTFTGSATVSGSSTGLGFELGGSFSNMIPIGANTYQFATDVARLAIVETLTRSAAIEESIKIDTSAYLKWNLDNVAFLNAIITIDVKELTVTGVPVPAAILLFAAGLILLIVNHARLGRSRSVRNTNGVRAERPGGANVT